MNTLRVAVAGGGLGGLCLAQGLLQAGADVTVYERNASLADRRLTVVSEKLRVLHEQVSAYPAADPYAPAILSTSVNRLTFREVLAAGLDGRIAFGHELSGYETEAGGVRLHFADGQSADADVLVGADGVNSAVRRQYLPAAEPADSGEWCIYGKTPLRGQAALPMDGFTAVVGGRITALDPAGLHALSAELIRTWHPDLRALHAEADIGQTFGVRVRTSPPVPAWPPSRVTVLGDAIHAMSPGRGSGANTALQDAALLSRTLAGGAVGGALVAAIGDYERQMREYGYAAVATSSQAEAETGARRNRMLFWLYRHLAPKTRS